MEAIANNEKLKLVANNQESDNVLFKINIERLETLLIIQGLIDSPEQPFKNLFTPLWNNNTPSIGWRYSQESLLYLFYKMNNYNRDILNGTFLEFIHRTFFVKGKILKTKSLAMSLSHLHKRYIRSGYQMTAPLLKVEIVLKQLKESSPNI